MTDFTEGLGEEPVHATLYNDDQLARSLDRLFAADRHSFLTELSGNAIRVYELETKRTDREKVRNLQTIAPAVG